MASAEESLEVRISVGADKVRGQLGGRTFDADIKLQPGGDPLRRETINVLVDMLREQRLQREREVKLLGGRLYHVLFDNQIGRELHALLQSEETQVVRVVLEFEAEQQTLASWPWEYLYCPKEHGRAGTGYFLSRETRLVLIRHLSSDVEPRELRVRHPPVRVLFIASSPKDLDDAVEYGALADQMRELKKIGKIDLRELLPERPDAAAPPGATYPNFMSALNEFEPHIVHIVAHGRRYGEHGEIAFMDDDERALWIRDEALGDDLWQAPRNLRCVFLQACESALASADVRDRYNAISGVAMELAQKQIPAVVGMQYEINQGVANLFARRFYKELSAGVPLDLAVQRGRAEVRGEERIAAARASNGESRLSFGLPVLYLGKSDALFPPESSTARETTVGGTVSEARTRAAPAQRAQFPARAAGGAPHPPDVGPPEACAWCGEPCEPWEHYCGRCDAALRCANCGTPVKKRRATCGFCHEPLEQPQAEFGDAART